MTITRVRQSHHPKRKTGGRGAHALVDRPDTGYGIFIENMLDGAE